MGNNIGYGAAHQSKSPLSVNSEESVVNPQTNDTESEVKAGGVSGSAVSTPSFTAMIDYDKHADEIKEKAAELRENKEAVMGYDDQIRMLEERKAAVAPESEEDRAKREKRERSNKIISAISDGLRSLGNLFFTSQYAPDMYKGSTKMLDRTNEAIEKAKAERERNNDLYFNYAMKIGDKENEKAQILRNLEVQREARKLAREKAKREEEDAKRKAALFEPQYQKAVSDAETAGYKSQTAQAEAEVAPEYYAGRNRLNDERAKTEGTKQQSYRASAYEHNQKGKNVGGNSKDPYHFDGKEYTKDSENDYKNAITSAAREVNLYFAEKNPDGSVKKRKKYNSEGKENGEEIVYRPGFEPIEVGYEDLSGVTRYYDWAETAAKVTPRLNQMREEKAAKSNKTMPGVKTNDNNKMPGVK